MGYHSALPRPKYVCLTSRNPRSASSSLKSPLCYLTDTPGFEETRETVVVHARPTTCSSSLPPPSPSVRVRVNHIGIQAISVQIKNPRVNVLIWVQCHVVTLKDVGRMLQGVATTEVVRKCSLQRS
jgi:hypothetical protein